MARLVAGFTIALLAVATAEPHADVTLFKVIDARCGQATLDHKFEDAAIKFAGLKEGTCPNQGYTEATGTTDLIVPVLGHLTVSLYKKVGLLEPTVSDGGSPTIPDAVTVFLLAHGECGEATLDRKRGGLAIDLAGIQEGTCSEHGYTKAGGTKALEVPMLGPVTIALFQKQDPLALVEALTHAITHVEAPCCLECAAPQVKYYSVDRAHNHCGECCMNPNHFYIFRIFEPNLTLADGKTCGSLGFPRYDITVTHGVAPLAMTLDLYEPSMREVAPDEVELYKLMDGICSQVRVPGRVGRPAMGLAGLQRGSCKQLGFTEDAGSAAMILPLLGDVSVSLHKPGKAADPVQAFRAAFRQLLDEQLLV